MIMITHHAARHGMVACPFSGRSVCESVQKQEVQSFLYRMNPWSMLRTFAYSFTFPQLVERLGETKHGFRSTTIPAVIKNNNNNNNKQRWHVRWADQICLLTVKYSIALSTSPTNFHKTMPYARYSLASVEWLATSAIANSLHAVHRLPFNDVTKTLHSDVT